MTEMTLVKFKELEETAPVMSDGGGLIVMDRRDVRAAASAWEADIARIEALEKDPHLCPACDGWTVRVVPSASPGQTNPMTVPCTTCDGRGLVFAALAAKEET